MPAIYKPIGAGLRPGFCHAPMSGYGDRQCPRRGVLAWTGEDGVQLMFCRLHHPEEVARQRREQAARAQREREQAERAAQMRSERTRQEALRTASTDDLIAECIRRGILSREGFQPGSFRVAPDEASE